MSPITTQGFEATKNELDNKTEDYEPANQQTTTSDYPTQPTEILTLRPEGVCHPTLKASTTRGRGSCSP